MSIPTITGILLLIFSILCLATGIYAFRRYSLTQSERLFAVGLAMCIAAVGIACGSLDSLRAIPSFNLNWAWYAGTTLGFLFLFLSSMAKSTDQFQLLKRWGVIAAAVLITVIILTPVFPADPSGYVAVILDTIRTIGCFCGFLRYVMLYTSKGTRFSLLMCLAFLFITVGYGILLPQLLDPALDQLTAVGVFIRIIGAGVLFAAFVLG
ncbi:MAG TPA: hypothetical protein VN207_07310 [Ktedonobacteraceae bacterium]|nr:hypothetical protein [Ktedonobacteraceae bacterium]